MRQIVVALAALLLAGSSVALSLPGPSGVRESAQSTIGACATPACAEDAARALTDGVVADLAGLPRDLASTVDAAIAIHGVAPAALEPTRSATLDAALARFYDAHGVAVDAATIARGTSSLDARDSEILRDLVDAMADAKRASDEILPAEDVAWLQDDLRAKMLRMTLLGDAELPTVLARADLAQAAAAAQRVARATLAVGDLLPATGCGRVVDLPFIVVGAPCDDVYPAGETVLLLVDYGGNDLYLNNAGAGIAGVGVGLAIDQGAGDDVYAAPTAAQGSATVGVGILVDEGGSDRYDLAQFGQGFATAGVAVLYDQGAGDDTYTSDVLTSIGTRAGGLGGIGVLRDDGGSDFHEVGGLDGFVYGAAGGSGILLDYGPGADLYRAIDQHVILLGSDLGNFVGPVMVSAEVAATAILYEEMGDTVYDCGDHVRQGCQGAGGVGGVALHLDLAGDDLYQLGESITPVQAGLLPVFPSGQGIAYGEGSAPPGDGIGVLRDLDGADAYVADRYAQGYATGGIGLLLDEAGADSYSQGLGLVGARGDGQTWLDGLALGVGVDR